MTQRTLSQRILRNLKDPVAFRKAAGYWGPRMLRSAVPLRLRMARARRAYLQSCEPFQDLLNELEQQTLDQIKKDGLVVIPGYWDRDKALALGRRLEPELRALQNGDFQRENRTHRYCDYGVYRILNVDRLDPDAETFMEDSMIWRIAKAATCANIISHQRMAELRSGVGRVSSADTHHFDEPWAFKFKSFLYLTDVTEETGPFVYMKGTLHGGPWRRRKERETFRDGKSGSWGHFFMQEIDDLKANHGFEETVCTGTAGTLILADTRGIHRSTTLRNGERILLANYFERPGTSQWYDL